MDFQQLRYFKAVATIGKIADAADSLFISAPALSTSISRLEKELGVRLFDRAGNRITLNAQGKIFLKHVNQIFFNLESAKQELKQSLARQSSHVSIVSINSIIWLDLITAFTSEVPQCTLASTTTSAARLIENGFPAHYSFLLAYESEIPPSFNEELDSVYLFSSHPVVMLHKDHPLANHDAIDVSMLANEKLFLPYPDCSLHSRLSQLFELRGLPLPSDSFHTHLARQSMVSQNLGVSFASKDVPYTHRHNIRFVPLVDPFEPWVSRLYWRKEHPLTEQEDSFRAFTEHFYRDLH